MRALSRKRLYLRLLFVVLVLLLVRFAVVAVNHRYPYGMLATSLEFPYFRTCLFLDHGSAGVLGHFESTYEWRGRRYAYMNPYSQPSHFRIVLPIEVWALAGMLGFLGLFRVWQLFFHSERDELVENS